VGAIVPLSGILGSDANKSGSRRVYGTSEMNAISVLARDPWLEIGGGESLEDLRAWRDCHISSQSIVSLLYDVNAKRKVFHLFHLPS
jgi:hypothetical protein